MPLNIVVEQKRVRSCLSLAFRSLREDHRLADLSPGHQFFEIAANLRRPGRLSDAMPADLSFPTKAQRKFRRQLKRDQPMEETEQERSGSMHALTQIRRRTPQGSA